MAQKTLGDILVGLMEEHLDLKLDENSSIIEEEHKKPKKKKKKKEPKMIPQVLVASNIDSCDGDNDSSPPTSVD